MKMFTFAQDNWWWFDNLCHSGQRAPQQTWTYRHFSISDQ